MSVARTAAARQPSGRPPAVSPASKGRAARPARRSTPEPRHRVRSRAVSAPRISRLPFLVSSFVVVGILVVGVASLQAVVSQGSFRMQDLTRRNVELQQEYGRLKLQVAELSSPGRIAAQARRLGFHLPDPDDVRTLRVKGGVQMRNAAATLEGPVLSLRSVLERRP